MPCVYELWPSADLSVPETQPNQGFANRALPVMYLSTANSGQNTKKEPDRRQRNAYRKNTRYGFFHFF